MARRIFENDDVVQMIFGLVVGSGNTDASDTELTEHEFRRRFLHDRHSLWKSAVTTQSYAIGQHFSLRNIIVNDSTSSMFWRLSAQKRIVHRRLHKSPVPGLIVRNSCCSPLFYFCAATTLHYLAPELHLKVSISCETMSFLALSDSFHEFDN